MPPTDTAKTRTTSPASRASARPTPDPSAAAKPTDTDTDARRWRAVTERDPAADGQFFYSVSTTGVYCRPTCPSRQALRKQVQGLAHQPGLHGVTDLRGAGRGRQGYAQQAHRGAGQMRRCAIRRGQVRVV